MSQYGYTMNFDVLFHAPAGAEEGEAHEEVPENDLNPIFPELKEVVWGFGAFIVLAVLMRWVLFPRMQKGTEARAGVDPLRSRRRRADHRCCPGRRRCLRVSAGIGAGGGGQADRRRPGDARAGTVRASRRRQCGDRRATGGCRCRGRAGARQAPKWTLRRRCATSPPPPAGWQLDGNPTRTLSPRRSAP